MNPYKIIAAIICAAAVISTAVVLYFLVPQLGPAAYAIAIVDAGVSVLIAFILWNKQPPSHEGQ